MVTPNKPKQIIWIHGWSSNQIIWHPIIPYFPQYSHYHPSFAAAEKSTDFSSLAELALINENLILIGWSMGGMLALEIANKFPDKVEKLVMINSSTKFTSPDPKYGWSKLALRKMIHNMNQAPLPTLERFINSCFSPKGCSHESQIRFKENLYQNDIITNCDFSNSGLIAGLDYLSKTDITSKFLNLKTPALWLHNRNDKICPVGNFENMKFRLKNSAFHHFEFLPDDGHISFYLNPELTGDIIKNFIK